MLLQDRIALSGLGLALAIAAAGAWLLLAPGGQLPGGVGVEGGDGSSGELIADPFGSLPAASTMPDWLVVDVEGAVLRPGIVRLPGGARVADAIDAAGGYSPAADLLAAMAGINLAAPLRDGQQIVVPLLGLSAAGSGGDGATADGLVNLNTASPEALDGLPGIGPVTVQKIVAAREGRPFTSLAELVERDVMTNAQLEGIRDLVTLG